VIGMNEDQMVENGSRGTFEVVMKILGKCSVGNLRVEKLTSFFRCIDNRKLINDNPRPLVLILVGNCKNGAYGLSTARRLYNHGHRVIVAMVSGESPACMVTDRQKLMYERIGGTIVSGIRGKSDKNGRVEETWSLTFLFYFDRSLAGA
jgi:NAD(P)H-hydrate repair Nnr-like enzyme with NAD(P)H-hydrate epimerase domain